MRRDENKIKQMLYELRQVGATTVSAQKGYDARKIANWSPQRIAALNRFYNQWQVFINNLPNQQFVTTKRNYSKRTRDAIARTHYGIAEKPKFISAEFLPRQRLTGPAPSVRTDKKGRLIYRQGKSRKYSVDLDAEKLAIQGSEYFAALIKELEEEGARVFVLKAGAHYFYKDSPASINQGVFRSVNEGVKQLERIMAKYGSDKFDQHDPNSHYYGNWLQTMEAHIVPATTITERVEKAREVRVQLQELEPYRARRRKEKKKQDIFKMRKRGK